MNIPTNQILPVFFAAMQNGYAGNASKSTIPELPGSNIIRYKQDKFEVVDLYFVTPRSDYSFGTTTVYYQGKAVWVMQYRGWYKKDIIPFLKRALQQTYEKSEFVGGRGPKKYATGDNSGLIYLNTVVSDDWRYFRGSEKIHHDHSQGSDLKGWHEYEGLLLL